MVHGPTGLPRPDGAGMWTERGRAVPFFLEYGTSGECLDVLTEKIAKYERPYAMSTWAWPVLFHLPSARREANLHHRLAGFNLMTVSRRRDRLEEYVEAVVIARLSRPDAAALLTSDDDGGERERAAQAAEQVRQRLDDAAASFAAGVITARQLATITGQLRPELAALEAAAAPPPDRASVLGELVSAADVEKAWDALSPDARRTVVRLLMEIRVDRGRRGPGSSTDGIEIIWR
ncbi:replication-relaxation family protein [Micromonospora sp. NPDC005113]